jgi:hypothetical protein
MTGMVLVAARHAQECAGEIEPAIQWPKLRCPNGGILGGSRGLNWRSQSLGREFFDPTWRLILLARLDTNRGNETWLHVAFAIVLNMRRIRLHRLFNRSRSSRVLAKLQENGFGEQTVSVSTTCQRYRGTTVNFASVFCLYEIVHIPEAPTRPTRESHSSVV